MAVECTTQRAQLNGAGEDSVNDAGRFDDKCSIDYSIDLGSLRVRPRHFDDGDCGALTRNIDATPSRAGSDAGDGRCESARNANTRAATLE